MNDREAATARVIAALDRGEEPAPADLLVCDTEALRRAAQAAREADPLLAADVDIALPRRE